MAREHLKYFWEAYRRQQKFEVDTPLGVVVIHGPDVLAKFMRVSYQTIKCYLSTGTEWQRLSSSLDFSVTDELRELGDAIGHWDTPAVVTIRRVQEVNSGE